MIRSNSSYVITPDAFSVNPALVGLPLARPARRLGAMLLDLAIVAVLVQTAGPVMLGLAAAWFAFRVAGKLTGTPQRPIGRMVRLSVRAFGALLLFIVASRLWSKGSDVVQSMRTDGVQIAVGDADGPRARVAAGQAVEVARQVSAFQSTDDDGEARRLAGELAAGFRASGMEEDEVREAMQDLASGTESPQRQERLRRAVDSALRPQQPAAARPVAADSLERAYAAAVQAGDTAAAHALRPQVASALARDSLDALRGELRQSERRGTELAASLEKLENRGLVQSFLHFLEELGIGFGWTGLYFTAFVALWKGQTPGKRLLGVRVVRLDGRPMTFWSSFERFGGYAAGLVTGLMGFAQVYWDRNRQMIHDKIVETVVVRERAGAPSPVRAEAAATSASDPAPAGYPGYATSPLATARPYTYPPPRA